MERHTSRKYDVAALKAAAAGRWLDIFHTLAGMDIDPNEKHHGPCPKCGGTDRFRAIDIKNGVLFCNQCFNQRSGDGIAALCWLTGQMFRETVKALADYLNVRVTTTTAEPAPKAKTHATIRGYVLSVLPRLVKQHGAGVKVVDRWKYPTFAVLRFNLPTPAGEKQRKEFRPVCRVPIGTEGIMGWRAGYPDGPRPLYRLPEVQAAAPDLMTVHGGEKAADAAAGLELPATTNAGGEQAIKQTDWAPLARFASVAIVVDNDPAGEKFGRLVAAGLKAQSPDQSIKIVRLPNLPPKGDIVEWIAAGGTAEQFRQVVEQLPDARVEPVQITAASEAEDDPHRLARINLDNYAAQYGGRSIVFWHDDWYTWKRNRYQRIGERELRAKLARSIKKEYDRLNIEALQADETRRATGGKEGGGEEDKPPVARKVGIGIVSSVLQATASMTVLSADIDPGTWIPTKEVRHYVSMANGILDSDALLADAEECMIPNTPKWFSMATVPYGFDPAATCPRWEAFLERNLELDPERIKVLQEWAGYLLLPETGEQKFLINEGEGANGKSVFTAGLTAMLGEENVSAVPLEVFGDSFSKTETIGKLLNAAGDCGEIDKAAEGFIKSFTGGDRMFFNRKCLPGINCRATARMMISCNNRPRFSDRTDGIWRRMLLIPWRIQIPKKEQVKGMDKATWWRDTGELPGIFNWAIRGLYRLRQQKGFSDSAIMDEAMADYKSEVNPARQFLLEFCKDGDHNTVLNCQELYAAYAKWAKSSGHTHPLAAMQFGKEVKRAFLKSERKRETSGDRARYYTGVILEIRPNEGEF